MVWDDTPASFQKPSAREPEGVVTDFGIVRFLQGAPLNTPQSLQSFEMLMGTPEYVSPEQAMGEQLDARSDIYSLAVTLFYLLTGFPPFSSDAPISTLLMHVHDTPPKLSSARADVTPRIDDVLARALSKWPDDRYQMVGEFGRELSEAISEAAQARTIDEVALTPSADRTLAGNRKDLAKALRPGVGVGVKPLARRSFHVTRAMAIALVLSVVLLGSSIVAALLYTATGSRTNHTRSITPKLTPGDTLPCASSSFPTSGTFFCKGGKYYIQNTSTQTIALALYQDHTFTNILLAVTASEVMHSTIVSDYYGVVLRSSAEQSRYYLFEISPDDGGKYYISRYDGGGQWHPLAVGPAPSVKQKPGQNNTIAVVAMGNRFTFLVNGQAAGKPIADTSATAFRSGEVGLVVEDPHEEVAFSNLQFKKI